ncbi:MAG: maltose alpha-D-glucosyltransferase [Desulfobacterales bacterium]|nr:maltose alpha-D-glucosyltransferase [Desulfobacterales bacterium]
MGNRRKQNRALPGDPLWYKDAMIYQLHVKTFFDSDGDGTGDFRGLTGKLDYLHDLGITAIWLLPFCPSPLKDDGYDIADYTGIHPDYGTMRDFKTFLREAHHRGLRVITELVVNHTSDQHVWFQRARRAMPGSRWRDFYVWSDTPERYKETRIIFQDFESSNWSWDPVAKAYYWHRFYSHQPDLNYDNPHVQKAILRVLDFWFETGVDGLRLDAIPYLYEREGTNCENLPETHEFLKKMRAHADERFENRMFLGEANQWPEDAVAYFGKGDECHMAFHFPLMPRMFMAIQMEDRFPIIDILDQTPAIPESCQWAIFLRNHDELTLEMVTDEERDYMYRVYAQDPRMRINLGIRRRLAPLLGNNRRRIELMSSLLFSIPGTPVIYYGDEIGMGDNVFLGDRNGVRTPMQWSSDRNAGFSRANPQRLYLPPITDPEYHYETINVEAQIGNRQSLLWWMKRLISIRKRFKAFCRGRIEFLHPPNHRILAFVRRFEKETILVLANLSRFVQYTEIDLSPYAGMTPVELFGRTEFPRITRRSYPFSFGPHGFYWFILEPGHPDNGVIRVAVTSSELPLVTVEGRWEKLLEDEGAAPIESLLPPFLQGSRWFGGKARPIRSAEVQEWAPLIHTPAPSAISTVLVRYMDGHEETYVLPLSLLGDQDAERVLRERPGAAIARLRFKHSGEEGILCDALMDEGVCRVLLDAIARSRKIRGSRGEFTASPTRVFQRNRDLGEGGLEPSPMKAEQTNTSILFGRRLILKVIRRLGEGVNPDLEIGRFLTERGCPFIPPVAGAIEYRRGREEPMTIAILQGFVPNRGDAWEYTLDALRHYFERALAERKDEKEIAFPQEGLLDLAGKEIPGEAWERIGTYLEAARLLGQRTAELHHYLASDPEDPAFAPEPFSSLYQRSLYQSMRTLTARVIQLLRSGLKGLSEAIRPEAQEIVRMEGRILDRFQSIVSTKIKAQRIRCHGDYHLGQVLYTGKDFVIIDFEGEPARPISERRIKRSPLRDVAGMIRSFHYAAYAALFSQRDHEAVRSGDLLHLESQAEYWSLWVAVAFLKRYLETAKGAAFLPESSKDLEILLDLYLLEKAVYELGYELNNRPEWVRIPLQGIRRAVEG